MSLSAHARVCVCVCSVPIALPMLLPRCQALGGLFEVWRPAQEACLGSMHWGAWGAQDAIACSSRD